jgi:hypothetical protein
MAYYKYKPATGEKIAEYDRITINKAKRKLPNQEVILAGSKNFEERA